MDRYDFYKNYCLELDNSIKLNDSEDFIFSDYLLSDLTEEEKEYFLIFDLTFYQIYKTNLTLEQTEQIVKQHPGTVFYMYENEDSKYKICYLKAAFGCSDYPCWWVDAKKQYHVNTPRNYKNIKF